MGASFHGLIAILVPGTNELGTVCWGTAREKHAWALVSTSGKDICGNLLT